MFTVPSKSQIFWGVVIAFVVITATLRFAMLYKVASGRTLPAA